MKTFLDEIGINIMQSIAGLFGSLLFLGKEGAKNLKQSFFAIITGTASANYLTPVVIEMTKIENTNYENGIAFILGFIGLKGVEAISKRFFKDKIKKDGNTTDNK
jgi:membrane-associated protease RseP (regulator of RpoE activity)